MRAKFIKESVIFVPKTKTELEQNFKNDTKIKYLLFSRLIVIFALKPAFL